MECFGRTWGRRPKKLLAVFTVHFGKRKEKKEQKSRKVGSEKKKNKLFPSLGK